MSVHCRMGKGRTGTLVACYMVESRRITAKEAIEELRQMRPGSVETEEQEQVVERYYKKVMGIKEERTGNCVIL